MKPHSVGLIDLGERLPFRVEKLAKTLNALQTSFVFEDAGVITSDALGSPDVAGKWYEIPRLCELIKKKSASLCEFSVGITHCRITQSHEDPEFDDRDYFSRSDLDKVAIMSVSKAVLKHNGTGKSLLQYAAFVLISELTIMIAKTDLNHLDDTCCVFNDCVDKDLLRGCIDSGEICPICVAAIKKANVPNSVLVSVRRVLAWCRRNSWGHAVKQTVQHPVTALALGTGLGWFSSIFVVKQYYPIMLAISLLPICVTLFVNKKSRD